MTTRRDFLQTTARRTLMPGSGQSSRRWGASGKVGDVVKILFLHGWHSIPSGVKDHGHEVINLALDDDDVTLAVKTAHAQFDQYHPQVVVGSSRCGVVAMNINSGDAKLDLLCTA